MLEAGGIEVSDPPAVCEFSARTEYRYPASANVTGLLRVPPIRLLLPIAAGSRKQAARGTRTSRCDLCLAEAAPYRL